MTPTDVQIVQDTVQTLAQGVLVIGVVALVGWVLVALVIAARNGDWG